MSEMDRSMHDTPVADSAVNLLLRDTVGNKTDAAVETTTTTKSLMAYLKGVLNLHLVPAADATTDTVMNEVVGKKDDTAQTTVGTTRSIIAYTKGLLNELAKIPKSDSTVSWNATALASVNAEVDTALNTIVPVSPTAGSLNDALSKAAGGNTFNKATDSLEALADTLGTAAELAKVPKSDAAVTWNATALASVNAEVDTALNTAVPLTPTANSLNDILSKLDGANTFDNTTDSLEAIRDKIDTLPTSSGTESATFTADGAITNGDLVGVTSAGKAAKLTADWAASAVPTTFTTIATGVANTYMSHSAWIDTNKFATVYNNNGDIYVVVCTIASDGTITAGTPVDSTFNATANFNPVRVVKLDTDKAQIFYFNSGDTGYGGSAVVTVSGTVPSFGANARWTAAEVPVSIDACQLGTDKCCAAYKITGTVVYHINGCTVSGTTQTWGTAANTATTSSASTGQTSIAKVATDLVAWFTNDDGDSIVCNNVSFSGANPTRNGSDTAVLTSLSSIADANGELTSCSPAANLAFVATVNSSATLVYIRTVTVSGTASPVAGVNTNLTYIPDSGTNVSSCSSQVLDSTHVAIESISGSVSYMGIIEIASVNLVRILYVGRVATGTIGANGAPTLIVQTNGKAIEIGVPAITAVVARPYTIYRKGLSTYADTPPTPVYGFLGVALASIADAATGSIGLKGTFTGYASGLNVLKKYVRGTNEYTFIKTVNKDYPYGEVLANVMSATAIEIMIPPGSSISTDNYWAFEYQPSLSGNGPWLALASFTVDTWTAWTSYLVPSNSDLFIEGVHVIKDVALVVPTAVACLDVVQVGYGATTVNVTLLASVPIGSSANVTTAGSYLIPAVSSMFQRKRVPAGQTIYMRYCRYAGAVTTEGVKIALTLSQLE